MCECTHIFRKITGSVNAANHTLPVYFPEYLCERGYGKRNSDSLTEVEDLPKYTETDKRVKAGIHYTTFWKHWASYTYRLCSSHRGKTASHTLNYWGSYTTRLQKSFRSQQTHAETCSLLYPTCLISSDWMESESEAKKKSLWPLHYAIFYEICQFKYLDWLWLLATNTSFSRL